MHREERVWISTLDIWHRGYSQATMHPWQAPVVAPIVVVRLVYNSTVATVDILTCNHTHVTSNCSEASSFATWLDYIKDQSLFCMFCSVCRQTACICSFLFLFKLPSQQTISRFSNQMSSAVMFPDSLHEVHFFMWMLCSSWCFGSYQLICCSLFLKAKFNSKYSNNLFLKPTKHS